MSAKDFSPRNRREYFNIRSAAPFLFSLSATGLLFGCFLFLPRPAVKLLFFPLGNLCTATTPNSLRGTDLDQQWHLMSDDEDLMRRALAVGEVTCAAEFFKERRTPKVAFMFLIRGELPLMPLWERFFDGQPSRLFSIYVHTSPEHDEKVPESSVFFRRRIPSKPVEWGQPTMIDAERRLLANALLDPTNQWFLLLSESCIPLFNFTVVHTHLVTSRLSYLSSFDDPRPCGRGRYNKRMGPTVSLQDWRKGSQWFQIHRTLAVEIVSDRRYYPVFRDHCRPPCYMDEHYLPTLLTKLFPGSNSNKSLTWVDWSRGGSHPVTYRRRDVSVWLVDRVRGGPSCVNGGWNDSLVCFLFARKFDKSALSPLMELAPRVLGF